MFPDHVEMAKSVAKATHLDGSQFEMNLFDPVPADSLNTLQRVASFLDEHHIFGIAIFCAGFIT